MIVGRFIETSRIGLKARATCPTAERPSGGSIHLPAAREPPAAGKRLCTGPWNWMEHILMRETLRPRARTLGFLLAALIVPRHAPGADRPAAGGDASRTAGASGGAGRAGAPALDGRRGPTRAGAEPEPPGAAAGPPAAGPQPGAGPDGVDADLQLDGREPQLDEPNHQRLRRRVQRAHQRQNFGANFGVGQLLPWGANYNVSLEQLPGQEQQHLRQPQPVPPVEPQRAVHPAAAPQLQDRRHPRAAARQPRRTAR